MCVEKIITRCSISNHVLMRKKNKINTSMLIACDAIKPQTNSKVSEWRALSIHRQMPLLKEQRRDLNKLKNLPGERPGGRRRADGMENTGSAQCVHWEEWTDKLKAMAFLAIFTAMRHYWFLRRKRILNVSRDPAFLSLSHSYTNSVSTPCSQQKNDSGVQLDIQQKPTVAYARHSSFWNNEHSSQRTAYVCLSHLFPFDTMQ